MEKVGALGLGDNLKFLATVIYFEYDAFLVVFRWVTISGVLNLLAGLLSQHIALFMSQVCVSSVFKGGFLHGHKLEG